MSRNTKEFTSRKPGTSVKKSVAETPISNISTTVERKPEVYFNLSLLSHKSEISTKAENVPKEENVPKVENIAKPNSYKVRKAPPRNDIAHTPTEAHTPTGTDISESSSSSVAQHQPPQHKYSTFDEIAIKKVLGLHHHHYNGPDNPDAAGQGGEVEGRTPNRKLPSLSISAVRAHQHQKIAQYSERLMARRRKLKDHEHDLEHMLENINNRQESTKYISPVFLMPHLDLTKDFEKIQEERKSRKSLKYNTLLETESEITETPEEEIEEESRNSSIPTIPSEISTIIEEKKKTIVAPTNPPKQLQKLKPLSGKRKPKTLINHYKHYYDMEYIFLDEQGDRSFQSSEMDESKGSLATIGNPDMSWIFDDVSFPTGTNNRVSKGENQQFSKILRFLWMINFFGNLPFVFYRDKNGMLQCKLQNTWHRILHLIITAVFTIVFILSLYSVTSILTTKINVSENTNNSENATKGSLHNVRHQIERLLLEKHWLSMTIFMVTLMVAVVGNFGILINEKRLIGYFNEWSETLWQLDYPNVTEGINILQYFHILTTAADSLLVIILVVGEFLEFDEKARFEIILISRYFTNAVHFNENAIISYIIILPFTIFQLYVYFVSRNIIMIVLLMCRCIINVAYEWNLRIAVLLKPDEEVTQNRKTSPFDVGKWSYRQCMDEHLAITKLVRKISHSFVDVFMIFFAGKVISICAELFRLSVIFVLNVSTKLRGRVGNSKLKYSSTDFEKGFELVYFVVTTLAFFGFTARILTSVGETVMNGFNPIRRYGLLFAKDARERKFILSLNFSFSSKNPFIINPGGYFKVDRGLVFGIIGVSLMIFSIMIQCKIVSLVTVPIVLPCPNDPNALCSSAVQINSQFEDPGNTVENTAILVKTSVKNSFWSECKRKRRKDSPKWVLRNQPSKQKCGLFCKDTQVFRMIPFDENGNSLRTRLTDSWKNTNIPNNYTFDCLANPYKDFLQDEVFDCFGNCFRNVDKCGHFAFGINGPLELMRVKNILGVSKIECYHGDHPLEICQVPFNTLDQFCDYAMITSSMSPEEKKCKIEKAYEAFELFGSIPLIHRKLNNAKCKNFPKTINENTLMGSGFFNKINYKGKSILQWKIYNLKMRELSVSSDDVFSYNYLHPSINRRRVPLGYYYDCFGNPLTGFDDCGGLSFPSSTTGVVTRDSVSGKNGQYSCYKNIIPNYKCGVPENLVDDICNDWKTYLGRDTFKQFTSFLHN